MRGEKGLRLLSFKHAFRGVGYMARHEPNMRFHLLAATGVLVAAAAFRLPLTQWAALIFAITLVLLGETLNTAIEAVLDLVQPDHHELVGVVKDLAAGAVLVASAGSAVIAAIVFIPQFWELFR
ncbi:MAG TPA: diacylglycerol kinase family protein [Acidimicrobiales bacterium]|nr:diacylglycerol kinase family protein [Acidimicrobiales bacterium]